MPLDAKHERLTEVDEEQNHENDDIIAVPPSQGVDIIILR